MEFLIVLGSGNARVFYVAGSFYGFFERGTEVYDFPYVDFRCRPFVVSHSEFRSPGRGCLSGGLPSLSVRTATQDLTLKFSFEVKS